jgi:hypothetical protein
MKNLLILLGIIGLIVGWGLFGAQQAKKVEYDCKVRVESLCFIWEKNEIGKVKDKVRDLVDQATK